MGLRGEGKGGAGGERVLTVLGAGDVGQDPEALGLQVGSTARPFRHVLRFSWPDHRLVDWRRTVHHWVLDWKSTTVRGTAALKVEEVAVGKGRRKAARTKRWRTTIRGKSAGGERGGYLTYIQEQNVIKRVS